jgi:hypothetical protein
LSRNAEDRLPHLLESDDEIRHAGLHGLIMEDFAHNGGVNCLACGETSSPASREHVFARWLLEELESLDAPINLYRGFGDGTSKQERVAIRLDSFKLKRVCTDCNNGWMSHLEETTKPILLGLIKGGRPLSALEEEERRILARWAGKTAIIESHSVGAESPVDPEFLRWMRQRDDNVPGRFCVAACPQLTLGVAHLQVGVIRDLIGGGIAAGNIIMIVLPGVAFACMFPMMRTEYEALCVQSLYTPLWPSPAAWKPMQQSPMPASFNGELDFLQSMAERVELFHRVK